MQGVTCSQHHERTRRLARLRRRLSPPELHCSISAPRHRLSPLDLGCSISTPRSCRSGWILLLEVRGFVQARDLLLPLHRLAQVNHQSLNQQHQVSNRCDRLDIKWWSTKIVSRGLHKDR